MARTACRQLVSGSRFTPLTGVLFTFPSRYLFAIGRQGVFSLGRWSSRIPTGFHVPRGTQVPSALLFGFAYGPVTLSGAPSQVLPLPTRRSLYEGPTTPHGRNRTVWALPISLATTLGISLDFFSFGY